MLPHAVLDLHAGDGDGAGPTARATRTARTMQCPECGQRCRSLAAVRRHVATRHGAGRRHDGRDGRLYRCGLCPAAFNKSCNLKGHMLVHTGERPFACRCCAMTFTQKSKCKRHMLVRHGVAEC